MARDTGVAACGLGVLLREEPARLHSTGGRCTAGSTASSAGPGHPVSVAQRTEALGLSDSILLTPAMVLHADRLGIRGTLLAA